MPDTYREHDDDETRQITRTCTEPAGCGREISVTLEPDGSYEGGIYFGEVSIPTEDAHVVGEHAYEDEWYGRMTTAEYSEYEETEFWMHEECAVPEDYDPDEVEHTVGD